MVVTRRVKAALYALPVVVGAVVLLPYARWSHGLAAPIAPGVCWRLEGYPGKTPKFIRVAVGDRNLETCAYHLEAVSIQHGWPAVTGAYQGQFVFVTPAMIQSALRVDGVRYRVFDAKLRAKLDIDIRFMLDDAKHPEAKPAP